MYHVCVGARAHTQIYIYIYICINLFTYTQHGFQSIHAHEIPGVCMHVYIELVAANILYVAPIYIYLSYSRRHR